MKTRLPYPGDARRARDIQALIAMITGYMPAHKQTRGGRR